MSTSLLREVEEGGKSTGKKDSKAMSFSIVICSLKTGFLMRIGLTFFPLSLSNVNFLLSLNVWSQRHRKRLDRFELDEFFKHI